MTGYTRQSVADIVPGETVRASPLNAEFNALLDAFNGTTGHSHEGGTGEGPKLRVAALGTWNRSATTDPGVNNDSSQGYEIGSVWVNVTADRAFICVDTTIGNAVWNPITNRNALAPVNPNDLTTKAYVDALGTIQALPPQAGNAGRFLTTDGSLASWGNVYPSFTGNAGKFLRVNTGATAAEWADTGLTVRATVTTATTLTAADNNLIPVAMNTASQSVTLPNSTTLTPGRQYTFQNTGTREFGIRANGGQLIARVGPGLTVSVYLRDNSTAAGQWAVEGQDALLPLTICDATLSSTYTQQVDVAVRLTDTLSLHFTRNASSHPFVFAVDHGTYPATVGTPVLIAAANQTVIWAQRISSTKAMVVIGLVSTPVVYNVTVSGTTCTVSSGATAASWSSLTFTGAPLIASLTADLHVAIRLNGAAIEAQAVDTSGTNPSAGSAVNIVATGGQNVCGVYRVSDTTALALYIDDSGTGGSPFSIRGVVLSLSGTTITVGTSAGVNDVVSSVVLPTVQLTATSYIVSYYQSSGTLVRAVHVGVSGTTTTFGTPLTVETASLGDQTFTSFNATRFQPNLFRLSDTTVLMTYGDTVGSGVSRHVVLTNSGGTLTPGDILYGLWSGTAGTNAPQRVDGFVVNSAAATAPRCYQITISGTSLTVTGNSPPPGNIVFSVSGTARWGLSGNYNAETLSGSRYFFYRNRPGGPPQVLGVMGVPSGAGDLMVELAPNRAGRLLVSPNPQASGNQIPRLIILEFPA